MAIFSSIRTLLQLTFPCICHACADTSSGLLCEACLRALPRNDGPRCSRCDLPLPQTAPLCSSCLQRPPSFTRCVSPWLYQAPLDRWLIDFKDKQADFWLPTLANALCERLTEDQNTPLPDLLVPLPLHWWRRWRRGYNQSALLAQYLSQRLNIPYQHALTKTRRGRSQKQLSRRERLRNLKGSFAIRAPLAGKRIALIDDVMTTGATAETACKTLKAAGAKTVEVWVLARTPLAANTHLTPRESL